MNEFSKEAVDAAIHQREVTLTTYGRKSGKPSEVTIFTVTDGRYLFILSGEGMARQWPQNLAARADAVLHLGGKDVKVKARHLTDPAETRKVAELYGSKYGAQFGPPPPGDPPRLSEQATFELTPASPV